MKTHYLFGEITAHAAEDTIRAIEEGCARIILCSPGGETGPALAIYDKLRNHKNVSIVATGECSSAAILVLLGADDRCATLNTRFFVHSPFAHKSQDLSPAEEAVESGELGHLYGLLHTIYQTRASKLAASYLASKEGLYMGVIGALECGLLGGQGE